MFARSAYSDELDPDAEAARRHFKLGSALYLQDKYADAILEFESAASLKPLPAFQYNIARCYDRLERWKDALSYYRKYLASGATDDTAEESKRRVMVLEARIAQKNNDTPATPPTTVEVAAPHATASPTRAVGGASLGIGIVGVVSLAAGAGLYAQATSRYDHFKTTCAPSCDPQSWHAVQMREQAGIGLIITGGVFAATAIALVPIWLKYRRQVSAR